MALPPRNIICNPAWAAKWLASGHHAVWRHYLGATLRTPAIRTIAACGIARSRLFVANANRQLWDRLRKTMTGQEDHSQ